MAQAISFVVLAIGVFWLLAVKAARQASDGNWGGPLGDFLFPFAFFYIFAAALYYGARLFRKSGRGFAFSRWNYVSLALTLAAVAAGPAADNSSA